MAASVSPSAIDVLSSDRRSRPRMAKADLRKAENCAEWLVIGQAMESVQQACGLLLKEFADKVKRNPRQVSRWFEGKERPQVDAVFAVPAFRMPLVVALAKKTDQLEVVTEIRERRTV